MNVTRYQFQKKFPSSFFIQYSFRSQFVYLFICLKGCLLMVGEIDNRRNLCSSSGLASNISSANLFPAKLDYPTASNLCKNLGGKMRFPTSRIELADIVKDNRCIFQQKTFFSQSVFFSFSKLTVQGCQKKIGEKRKANSKMLVNNQTPQEVFRESKQILNQLLSIWPI